MSGLVAGEARPRVERAVFGVLGAISFCHLLNDLIQSLLPAIYPLLKTKFSLNFAQIGLLTLAFQFTASLLQPMIGFYTDRRSSPFSLPVGMFCTLLGLLLLSRAGSFGLLVLAACMVGAGSAVFHPESSRVARMASGGRYGMAQSVFQVGGNSGQAIGPLLAAFIVVPGGQRSIAWFTLAAMAAILVLVRVGVWYRRHGAASGRRGRGAARPAPDRRTVVTGVAILLALIFSKFFYLASINSYYTFYLIHRFHLSVRAAQVHLFIFLGAVALGTMVGGPIGDRIGRRRVIWVSILGVLPFTLALPHANLFWTGVLSVPIGMILASAFPAIIVFAQDLMPGKVGTVSGLFFGMAFGLGGLGAALLGVLADHTSITFVYDVCAFLPVIGVLALLLPDVEGKTG